MALFAVSFLLLLSTIESAMVSREVLVKVGVHSRIVRFDDDLHSAIRLSFSDLPQVANRSTRLILQVKKEEWDGEFVDLGEDEEISDRCVLKVIPQAELVSSVYSYIQVQIGTYLISQNIVCRWTFWIMMLKSV